MMSRKGGVLSPRDRLQVALFQLRYGIHRRDGKSVIESFGMAIVETSDQAVDVMLVRNPKAVEDWIALKQDQAAFNRASRQEQELACV